ncbi:hypothetical protein ACQPZX_09080 [Actinoplanes sp. CA-142083]|uniref:hypothetical protein n=1 Tax=Actinoplanes sp. CA-142083 TaxID=3239903 RepID=UPI003D9221EE
MVFRRKQVAKAVRVDAGAGGEQSAAETEAPREGRQGDTDEDLAGDLMRRVGTAIDDWSAAHGLDGLPRKVVFQQALSYLNALADTVGSKPK